MRASFPTGLVLAVSLLLAACQSEKIDNTMIVAPEGPVSFAQDVQPILSRACGGAGCHIGERMSGVELSSYAQVMTSIGVQYGEAIVTPGDADASPLVDKIEASPQFGMRMPLDRAPLSGDEIARIRAWIDDGAEDN